MISMRIFGPQQDGNPRTRSANRRAYAGNAVLSVAELTLLIGSVTQALSRIGAGPAAPKKPELKPAFEPKKSVLPDFIICLEDSRKLKMLKRHPMTHSGLTPAAYREKWGLPPQSVHRSRDGPRASIRIRRFLRTFNSVAVCILNPDGVRRAVKAHRIQDFKDDIGVFERRLRRLMGMGPPPQCRFARSLAI